MYRVMIIVHHRSGQTMTTSIVECNTKDDADIVFTKASELTTQLLKVDVIKLY